MLLFQIGIVSIVLVLILVILWSGITYPGFVYALRVGKSGPVVFWGIIIVYLAAVSAGFAYIFDRIDDPMVRGFGLLVIPMMLGIPFRMTVGMTTKKWILKKLAQMMIRPATNKDIDKVTMLIYEVLGEYGLQPDPEHTDADLKDLEGNYANNNGSFDLLLSEDGEIIGSVGILRLDDQKCELRKMYLKESCRGKGFGKLLLEHGLEKAKELGYQRVILETASVLKEAITLYGKYGFKRFEMKNPSSRCDQMYYLDI